PRCDHGAAAREPLERSLAEGLDEARLAEDVRGLEVAGDGVVGHVAGDRDARPPLQGWAQRPVADERQRSLVEAPEGIREPDDVLPLDQRADTEKGRRGAGRALER